MNKSKLIEALHDWIARRPGLSPADYCGDLSAYRSDARRITKDLNDARYFLDYVAIRDSITAEQILDAAKNNFSGRLSITPVYVQNSGCYGLKPEICRYELEYCPGQWWAMEYRKAAAAVLKGAIWEWLREGRTEADTVRKAARREFPASIARRWFQ